MSKYTTEVRFICENATGRVESVGYNDINTVIEGAIPVVFNFTFPIFDEAYRNVLCTKILKHYYTREICEETVGLWKLRLDARMNEIMPYYNKLYESELLEFNPLYDVHITTENNANKNESKSITDNATESKGGTVTKSRDLTDNATTTNSAETTGSSDVTVTDQNSEWNLYSDTPQGALTNVENEEYLTNARKISNTREEATHNENSGSSTGNGTYTDTVKETNDNAYEEDITKNRNGSESLTSTDSYIQTVMGKTGGISYSKMLEEFRRTFLNIDMMVIDALSDLFFGLW